MKVIYDAGALIALEQNDRAMWRRLKSSVAPPLSHGGVVGQAWRDGTRQVHLVRALRSLDVKPVDEPLGRRSGELLAVSRTSDVIDAAVVAIAAHGDVVYTSDPDDIGHLATSAGIVLDIVPV